jgi:antitoxin YefM
LLKVELETIQNPVAKAAIEHGLNEAITDEDFSSLLETFHLLSSPANADRLIAALERSKMNETRSQSVEEFRQEMGLVEETL